MINRTMRKGYTEGPGKRMAPGGEPRRRRLRPGFVAILGGLALCSTPARGWTPFTEESAERGVNYTTYEFVDAAAGGFPQCQGAAFADLDRDGDDDLVMIGESSGMVRIYENDGTGYFSDSAASGLPLLERASAVTAADYDADGDLDLHFTQFSRDSYLLRNEGEFRFTNVTAAANVVTVGSSTGSTWGDYDNDGYLDLYVCNYSWSGNPINNRLYHNLGDGTFEQVAEVRGVHDPNSLAFQASFVDYNLDGFVDLYSVNDRGMLAQFPGNNLWRNLRNGTFQNVSESTGTDVEMWAMGLATGDFDRNGWPDFYVTNIQTNVLLLSDYALDFADVAGGHDVLGGSVGWGALFFDANNDGWQELYACNTLGGLFYTDDRIYSCSNGAPPCVDRAVQLGVNVSLSSYSVTSSDIDDDGDVDILVIHPNLPAELYVNHAEAEAANWLKVRLVGHGANRDAVGATVFVLDETGWQQRSLVVGDSYKAQQSMTLHFGLGDSSSVDSVRVLWPGGIITANYNIAANRTVTMTQPNPSAGPIPPNTNRRDQVSAPMIALPNEADLILE